MPSELMNGLFVVAGAIIGVAGSWLVARRSREVRKLTIFRSPTARLLGVSDFVRSDVEILFRGQPVEALAIGEIAIQSTGSVAVEGVELSVVPQDHSPVIDLEIKSTNFGPLGETISLSHPDGNFLLNVPFLNPKDRIVLEYRVFGRLKPPNVTARLKGVDVEVKHEMVSWLPDIYMEVVFSMFSRMPFGYVFRLMKPMRLYLESQRGRTKTHIVKPPATG